MTLLLIVIVVCLLCGGLGHAQWGAAGWSPLGLVLAIILVLWLTGNLGRLHL